MFTARLSLVMLPVVSLVKIPEPDPLTKLTPLTPPEIAPELLIVVSSLVSIAVALVEETIPPALLLIVTPVVPF